MPLYHDFSWEHTKVQWLRHSVEVILLSQEILDVRHVLSAYNSQLQLLYPSVNIVHVLNYKRAKSTNHAERIPCQNLVGKSCVPYFLCIYLFVCMYYFSLFVYSTGFLTQFVPGTTKFTPERRNVSDVHSCRQNGALSLRYFFYGTV
jgi:hypothetical protein